MSVTDPGHREIILNYETGCDDGVAASGYFLVRDKAGDLLRVGTFYTDGEGEFRFYGWNQPIEEPPEVDAASWDDEELLDVGLDKGIARE